MTRGAKSVPSGWGSSPLWWQCDPCRSQWGIAFSRSSPGEQNVMFKYCILKKNGSSKNVFVYFLNYLSGKPELIYLRQMYLELCLSCNVNSYMRMNRFLGVAGPLPVVIKGRVHVNRDVVPHRGWLPGVKMGVQNRYWPSGGYFSILEPTFLWGFCGLCWRFWRAWTYADSRIWIIRYFFQQSEYCNIRFWRCYWFYLNSDLIIRFLKRTHYYLKRPLKKLEKTYQKYAIDKEKTKSYN